MVTLAKPQTSVPQQPLTPPQLLSTPFFFSQWLQTKDPDEYVGCACLSSVCPIAEFLHDEFPNTRVAVMHHIIWVGDENFDTPYWVQKFIQRVDDTNAGETISAYDAQACLTAVITTHA